MTLAEALHDADKRLRAAQIDGARLEAEVLLQHALGLGREVLLMRLQEPLPAEAQTAFEGLVRRRLAHEPTAYIVGHKEFYGLEFACSPAVLIPRPETELLVEVAIEWLRLTGPAATIADVGTGTGAIAVALAVHVPAARVTAIDTSLPALVLARRNAAAHDVAGRVDLVQGAFLEPVRGQFDSIVANLPYIPSQTYNALPPEIREHEPEPALRAGRRGTSLIEQLLEQAADRLRPGGLLLAEHGWNQARRLRQAARAAFPRARIDTKRDLAGLDRLLVVEEN